jgi:hypothetical protein
MLWRQVIVFDPMDRSLTRFTAILGFFVLSRWHRVLHADDRVAVERDAEGYPRLIARFRSGRISELARGDNIEKFIEAADTINALLDQKAGSRS